MNSAAKRLLCLVNSRSGDNRGMEVAKRLLNLSLSSFDKIEVKLLDQLASLPAADLIEKEYSLVLLAGGDGTFSTVLGHYSGTNIDFLLLPLGTGNDLARELGIKKLWKGELQSFLKKGLALPSKPLQVWQATFCTSGEEQKVTKFLNYLSLGWDGLVVEKFDRMRNGGSILAGKFGPWGNRLLYWLAALRHPLYRLPLINVKTNSKIVELNSKMRSLVFSNICSFMGLAKSNTKSDCTDEMIEMCSVQSILDYLKMLLPTGAKSKGNEDVIQSDNFTVRCNQEEASTPVQIDGEYFGLFRGESISIMPAGKVLVRHCLTS